MLQLSLSSLAVGLLTLRTALALPGGGNAVAHGPNNYEPQCSPRVIALATGIQLNIVAQHGELNQTETLIALESSATLNKTAIYEGIGGLIDDIEGGIAIRKYYVSLAPPGNAALPGLATYAAAQLVELSLSESLTGVPANDLPILETIKGDVMTGIQLNENNTAAALKGCSLEFVFPTPQ